MAISQQTEQDFHVKQPNSACVLDYSGFNPNINNSGLDEFSDHSQQKHDKGSSLWNLRLLLKMCIAWWRSHLETAYSEFFCDNVLGLW